jgi:predicted Zn-dependent protease
MRVLPQEARKPTIGGQEQLHRRGRRHRRCRPGVRVLVQEVWGFVSSSQLDARSAAEAVDRALASARLQGGGV